MFQRTFIQSGTGQEVTEEEIRQGDFGANTFFVEPGTGRQFQPADFQGISGPEDEPQDTEASVITSDVSKEDQDRLDEMERQRQETQDRQQQKRQIIQDFLQSDDVQQAGLEAASRLTEIGIQEGDTVSVNGQNFVVTPFGLRRSDEEGPVSDVSTLPGEPIETGDQQAGDQQPSGQTFTRDQINEFARQSDFNQTARGAFDESGRQEIAVGPVRFRETESGEFVLHSGDVSTLRGDTDSGTTGTGMTDTERKLRDQLNETEEELQNAMDDLDQVTTNFNEATDALVQSIKQQYKARKKEVRDMYERERESVERSLIRAGTQRFTVSLSGGVLSEVERQKISKLQELDAEEAKLIAQARQAQAEQNFGVVSEKIAEIQSRRDEKIKQIQDLQEAALEQRKELQDAKNEMLKDAKVTQLWNEGIQDPSSIFATINSNPQFKDIPITLEEVEAAVDAINSQSRAVDAQGALGRYQDAAALGLIDPTQTSYFEFIAQENAIEAQAEGETAKNRLRIQSAVSSDPQFGTFVELSNSFNSVETGFDQNDSAGDIAMIAGIAKLVDPGSVVRPSEFETVQGALGILEQVGLMSDIDEGRLTKGRRLNERIRRDFLALASNLVINKAEPIKQTLKRKFEPTAEELGVSFESAVPEVRQMEETLRRARQNIGQEDGGGVSVNIPESSRLASVNNNPGNLKFEGQQGATEGEDGFARFSSPEEGFRALERQIELDKNRGDTIREFVEEFAPPTENDTEQYIQDITSDLGVDESTPLSELSTRDIAIAVAKKESSTTFGGSEQTVTIQGKQFRVGEVVESSDGRKGIVNADGTITIIEE